MQGPLQQILIYSLDLNYFPFFPRPCLHGRGPKKHSLKYAKRNGVKKDAHKAATRCQKAAEQGRRDAQYNLGCLYEDGYGVDKDVSKATEWFLHAAHTGG